MLRQYELWPCHPHPLPDELLSCWLVRVAHAHKLKVQTFSDQVFGKDRQIWNRDIDRQAPRWVVNRLSKQTGTNLKDAHQTALTAYRQVLYPRRQESGILPWILPLDIWHRKYEGHGLQFCPVCLAEDEIPYYRKRWRVALYTCCTKHNAKLHDRCPACGIGVAFHRTELGRYGVIHDLPLTYCHQCGFDLRDSPVNAPNFFEDSSQQLMLEILSRFEGNASRQFDLGYFKVLRQLCKILLSNSKHTQLRRYATDQINASDIPLAVGRISFEERSLEERHHILQLALWLMANPEQRIIDAWQAKAVRFNVLKKDFTRGTQWYRDILKQCANSRAEHFLE